MLAASRKQPEQPEPETGQARRRTNRPTMRQAREPAKATKASKQASNESKTSKTSKASKASKEGVPSSAVLSADFRLWRSLKKLEQLAAPPLHVSLITSDEAKSDGDRQPRSFAVRDANTRNEASRKHALAAISMLSFVRCVRRIERPAWRLIVFVLLFYYWFLLAFLF